MGNNLFSCSQNYRMEIDHYGFPKNLENIFFVLSGKVITEISFTDADLLYDIVTCGMPEFWINKSCVRKRLEEIKYKIYLMRTALEVDDDGYIIVSDNIKYLDSSEKNFISYYIGMFMTKLISRKIFHYEYLVHLGIVSTYKKVVRFNKEPDLVGFNKKGNKYALFEAKGRQVVRPKMVMDAKNQINAVKYINGKKPSVGVVCVAHPIKEGSRVVCSIYDPIPDENGKIDVSIGELLYLYYLPIYELIQEQGGGETYCNIYYDEVNEKKMECRIEMSKELFDFFNEHPNFNELDQSDYYSQLMEFRKFPSKDEGNYDLLKIKLCEYVRS